MQERANINKLQPEAYKAMSALEGYLATTQITKAHKELIKIRASQINRCAFCIAMHTKDALKQGESIQRIFLLDAWRETNLFSEEEKLILAITEEVTLIQHQGLSDQTYQAAVQVLGETLVAQVIMAVIAINAWNRIGISTNMGFAIRPDHAPSGSATAAYQENKLN